MDIVFKYFIFICLKQEQQILFRNNGAGRLGKAPDNYLKLDIANYNSLHW